MLFQLRCAHWGQTFFLCCFCPLACAARIQTADLHHTWCIQQHRRFISVSTCETRVLPLSSGPLMALSPMHQRWQFQGGGRLRKGLFLLYLCAIIACADAVPSLFGGYPHPGNPAWGLLLMDSGDLWDAGDTTKSAACVGQVPCSLYYLSSPPIILLFTINIGVCHVLSTLVLSLPLALLLHGELFFKCQSCLTLYSQNTQETFACWLNQKLDLHNTSRGM